MWPYILIVTYKAATHRTKLLSSQYYLRVILHLAWLWSLSKMSQLMWKKYLSQGRTVKAQASLRICTVSPEPSLFAHTIKGFRGSFVQRATSLALLSGCACAFEGSQSVKGLRSLFIWDCSKYNWAAAWLNQQNDNMCAQWRLRSAWASAQSNQSLCCVLNG